jgi:chromosome segregation ATPase
MATEEKKSIEISYKANIKDLVSKLEQIPNVTKEEAKKMVAALDRQLKQAEKAAKKSADAQKKVAKEMAAAAKRGARDFDDLADSAAHAGQRMEMVAEKSGDIDRGFSGVGLALRGVNPQLAEAADGMADTFAVVESLIMGFGALNPLVLAGAVAVGGLALGYMAYTEEAEKARQLILDLRDAQRQLNDETTEQTNNLVDAGGKLREMRNEYKLLTGQISEYEFNLEKAGEAANESFRANIEQAQQSIAARELELKTVQALIQAQKDGTAVVLSDEEKERLRVLQLQTDTVNNQLDLTKRGLTERAALLNLEDELQRRIGQQQTEMRAMDAMRAEAVDLAQQMVELENELAQANEAQAAANERSAKAKKEIAEVDPFDAEAVQGELNAIRARNDLQAQYNMALLDDTDKQIQKVEDRYQKEYENLLRLGIISGEHELAQQMAYELDKQRLAEIDEIQQANHEKQLDRISEQVDKYTAMGSTFTGSLKTFASAVGEYLENTDRATDKSVKRLFRLEQTAAVADIAMETAKAIAGSLGLPPGVRGVTIAAITAAGAAQTAAVLSQQPPTLHMGGMAPDETNATLLTGEAVLDRTTVRNIGGQQGVRQLQNGQTGTNNVVIIQPFKHIDRYNRSARRVAGRVHAGAY